MKTRVCVSSGMLDARRRRGRTLRTASMLTGAALFALIGECTHSDYSQLAGTAVTAQKRAESINDALSRSARRQSSTAGKTEGAGVLEMSGVSSASRADHPFLQSMSS